MPDRADCPRSAVAAANLPSAESLPQSGDYSPLDQEGFYVAVGKRFVDIGVSLFGLIFFLPILLTIGVLIKLTSRGPALFHQQRVGKDEKLFRIVKFRTMVNGAEKMGGGITPRNDPRVTPLGVFLRQWKLDELPQLWNVLRGQMSIVGPRPELPLYVALYTDEQRAVLRVKPGITDLASLRYRNEDCLLKKNADPELFYRKRLMPDKLDLNLQYLKNISFGRDLHLVLSTVRSIMRLSKPQEFD